jgi:(1->4)-alpha-D-glucan 1-alpha-D-glucosylmutase
MNATMTHDAKHAEDFRARVNVLSEIPQEWSASVSRWSEWNTNRRTQVGNHLVPEPNEEMLIYQALLGSWPTCDPIDESYVQRIHEFVVKAGREAMVHTRWAIPNVEHEKALTDFVVAILTASPNNLFLGEFGEFAARIAFHGMLNSLAQLLIKIGSPGVPDFYQGSELWDLRLVDPDNRQPVDFHLRTKCMTDLMDSTVQLTDLLSNSNSGMLKMFVAQRALQFRREQSQLFLKGKYLPLFAQGSHKDSVFAFARQFQRRWALIVVPRFTTRLSTAPTMPLGKDAWCDTVLPLPEGAPREWTNLLTQAQCDCTNEGEVSGLAVRDIFREIPVALLSPKTARGEIVRVTRGDSNLNQGS